MDKPVGSNTIPSFAYSSTTAGAANPRPRIASTRAVRKEKATIDGHLRLFFPLLDLSVCSERKEKAAEL